MASRLEEDEASRRISSRGYCYPPPTFEKSHVTASEGAGKVGLLAIMFYAECLFTVANFANRQGIAPWLRHGLESWLATSVG